jgi:hypothetical protein
MRKVTTPVPVERGVAGGALPMRAGTSPNGRRKPNGSACQHRTMPGVHDAAKHAMSAMSPLKLTSPRAADGARRAGVENTDQQGEHIALYVPKVIGLASMVLT